MEIQDCLGWKSGEVLLVEIRIARVSDQRLTQHKDHVREAASSSNAFRHER